MTDHETVTVTRPQVEPTSDAVYEEMDVGRCYVVADLVAAFEDVDANRWTVQNRLDSLADEERIVRREHVNDRVTYQRPYDPDEREDNG